MWVGASDNPGDEGGMELTALLWYGGVPPYTEADVMVEPGPKS